jgi:hypothetical protein
VGNEAGNCEDEKVIMDILGENGLSDRSLEIETLLYS